MTLLVHFCNFVRSLLKKTRLLSGFINKIILGYTVPVSVASANGTTSSSPLNRTSSPPENNPSSAGQQSQQSTGGSGQSPMAALMSVADNLPPGSPRSAGGSPPSGPAPRSASRGSQHSPNSTGKHYRVYLFLNVKIL